ncbi:hypothetical protein [Methanopyrus sp.]
MKLRSLNLIPDHLKVRPLALRYLKRLEDDHPDILQDVVREAVRISEEEGHMEIRAETLRKAYAYVKGITLREARREFFPKALK